jgi:hypothetical protein
MMSQTHRFRTTVVLFSILGTAATLAIAASLIPDNPYLRFQLLKNTFHAPVPWTYERIHFDSRPIDVVIIGDSRIWLGVSPIRMEENLSRSGLSAGVVNFSMPQEGRNTNYVIIKELFRAERRPKILVVGVVEKPSRFGHPAFKYISDTSDVAEAAYPINLNYLSDLSYLPFRQLKLAAMRLFPHAFNVALQFDPTSYVGSNYDATVSSRFVPDRFLDRGLVPRKKLVEDAAQWEKRSIPPLLPAAMADLEFGDENFYIKKIAALAKASRVQIAFLYIPYFSGPPSPLEESFYSQYGPVFKADFVNDRDHLFLDYAHLNRVGAVLVTDWLSDLVASSMANDQSGR